MYGISKPGLRTGPASWAGRPSLSASDAMLSYTDVVLEVHPAHPLPIRYHTSRGQPPVRPRFVACTPTHPIPTNGMSVQKIVQTKQGVTNISISLGHGSPLLRYTFYSFPPRYPWKICLQVCESLLSKQHKFRLSLWSDGGQMVFLVKFLVLMNDNRTLISGRLEVRVARCGTSRTLPGPLGGPRDVFSHS
jgi:hypothetical protein